MSVISMKQLLEAGVHFGHQTRRWNPKMDKYIYASRNGIHIVDLQITVSLIEEAYKFITDVVKAGKPILFVGTKKQAQEAIEEEANRCGQYFINKRWLGGLLTNQKTIKTRIDRLNKLDLMEKMGEFDLLPKKEVSKLKAEREKLNTNLGGIRNMNGMPGVIFIVDPTKEGNAISEARALNIPLVAIVDTNCDPDLIDYVIPGNDDAIRAIKLITSVIADAVIEANQGEQMEVSSDEENLEAEVKTEEITEVKEEEIKEEEKEEPKKAVKKAVKKDKKEEEDKKPAKKAVKEEKAKDSEKE